MIELLDHVCQLHSFMLHYLIPRHLDYIYATHLTLDTVTHTCIDTVEQLIRLKVLDLKVLALR